MRINGVEKIEFGCENLVPIWLELRSGLCGLAHIMAIFIVSVILAVVGYGDRLEWDIFLLN